MKYKLISPINPKYNTIEQILTNRHIPLEEVAHYLNTTDKDINVPEALGQACLTAAACALLTHINNEDNALVIVDCDCDGFTAAAVLINYLHDIFPAWVENHLKW